jgi:hypothetical protein
VFYICLFMYTQYHYQWKVDIELDGRHDVSCFLREETRWSETKIKLDIWNIQKFDIFINAFSFTRKEGVTFWFDRKILKIYVSFHVLCRLSSVVVIWWGKSLTFWEYVATSLLSVSYEYRYTSRRRVWFYIQRSHHFCLILCVSCCQCQTFSQ